MHRIIESPLYLPAILLLAALGEGIVEAIGSSTTGLTDYQSGEGPPGDRDENLPHRQLHHPAPARMAGADPLPDAEEHGVKSITEHPAYLWGLLILAALGEGIVEALAKAFGG